MAAQLKRPTAMPEFNDYIPAELKVPEVHQLLIGGVAPRPIALASTMDKDGRPNLAPFSFFGVFGARPPILVFAPNRSGRTGLFKDTANNLLETDEVVIHIVTEDILHQMNLAASEFPADVDEFAKTGLTPVSSQVVRPWRVAESPIHYECKVLQRLLFGAGGGASALMVCEVVRIHVDQRVLDANGKIDPQLVRAVARMGGSVYTKAWGDALFNMSQPFSKYLVGVDGLPEWIRHSDVLTGNDLARLGTTEALPDSAAIAAQAVEAASLASKLAAHTAAKALLLKDKTDEALALLLAAQARLG